MPARNGGPTCSLIRAREPRNDVATADYAMPTLLKDLAAPDCSKTDDQWDRCGVYYVAPIEGSSRL